MLVHTLRRDLGHSNVFTDPGALARPEQWTAEWVRHRLVDALTIERKIPDKRVGVAVIKAAWKLDPVDGFAGGEPCGEAPGRQVWHEWARLAGATATAISRLEEALSWLGQIAVGRAHRADAVRLLAWAYCVAHNRPLEALLQRRGWTRAAFYRSADRAAERIAARLNASGVAVR